MFRLIRIRAGSANFYMHNRPSVIPKHTQQTLPLGALPAGCSKSSSSKAAASEGPQAYPLGYVEGLNDARTPLADFFSVLLDSEAWFGFRGVVQVLACVFHVILRRLLNPRKFFMRDRSFYLRG
jgi:hypothetical protein